MARMKKKGWLKLISGSGVVGILVTIIVTGSTGNPMAGKVAGDLAERASDAIIEEQVAE